VANFCMPRLGPLPAFLVLYAAMYAAFGAASPFWPRYFEARGLTPEELGILFGLGTAVRVIAGPLPGRIADILGAPRAILAVCIATAVAAALGLMSPQGFWLLLVVHLAHAAAGFEYGWVRGAASAAVIAGTLAAGQVLGHFDLSAIVWMHAALLAGAVLGAALMPKSTHTSSGPRTLSDKA
jgi:PPP family 3-phenylpropionic acid transporter